MASNSQKIVEAASTDSPTATPEVGKQSATTTEVERIKATRYPRWTRQETLLLIEAKKMVENRDHLCNFNSSSSILNHTDPKWNIVSSCIQQKGVKRGPLQCRKRWGNLLTDFRKVKKYETDTKGDDGESFWMMRSDKRKENKLPGFFDEVVFRVLDGEALSGATLPLALIKMASKPENSAENVEKMKLLGQSEDDEDDEDYEDDEDETVYDSEKKYWEGNSERKMVFSAIKASTSKETFLRGSVKVTPTLALALALAPPGCQKEPESEEGYKKRRLSPENHEDRNNFSNDIMKVLRRNNNMMKTYLEAQHMNHQLAMEQQKEQSNKLVAALGKITDAITKIADKK